MTASLGSACQKRVLGGVFSASVDYRRGVDALGALPRLNVLATGQWSPDELLPAERFSIGSFGAVRGFRDGG